MTTTCPLCGASAGDDDVFCEADGARLQPVTKAPTLPAAAGVACPACAVSDADDGDGYCKDCGHRLDRERTTWSAPIGTTISASVGELTVVRLRGAGEVVVADAAARQCLLVFGAEEAVGHEALALAEAASAGSVVFPPIIDQGKGSSVGHFLVLGAAIDDARPVASVAPTLTWAASLGLLSRLLDAATELEAMGFVWEPAGEDIYVRPKGELVIVRARGARKALQGEPLNAKRVIEAVGPALLPNPACFGTPEIVRLLMPAFNASTPRVRTVAAAREDLARAEAVAARKSDATVAELCDPGLRRNHNEDATGLAQGVTAGEPWTVLVVCDGVSSSTHADQASSIASKVATDSLAHFARSGDISHEGASSAVLSAVRAAHVAICTSDIEYGDGPPPGTTIVVALIYRKRLTVGWVGDSRAYWVSPHGAELCTTDHSWVNEAVARGEMSEAKALASPLAHALTRCLGPLETGEGTIRDVEPDARAKALPGRGHVILCTDGLWNYFPSAAAVAGLVQEAGEAADPGAIARFLVCQALAQGGGDNVSVVVYASA